METQDTTICLVGGTGDLAVRRIIPALFELWQNSHSGKDFSIVGIARSPLTDESYRSFLHDECKKSEVYSWGRWASFASSIFYMEGDAARTETWHSLKRDFFTDTATNGLFILACVPERFPDAAKGIAMAGIAGKNSKAKGWRRLMVEKPFGTDLASARALNRLLHESYDESDIFRVDHYLGKDSVQNLLYFRFANSLFEPVWNRHHIERIEISVNESGGIGRRGRFYDDTGAARDMIQSHLMQLFCLVAMDRPQDMSQEAVREEKVKLLKAVPRYDNGEPVLDWIRAQYTTNAKKGLASYLDEPFIRPDSTTETFAAIKLSINNWRWAGVPFILSTGKAMSSQKTEINIIFRQGSMDVHGQDPDANRLGIQIQPDEKLTIGLNVKAGSTLATKQEAVSGIFQTGAKKAGVCNAYLRLLGDAIAGDPTLFIRFDETEEAWRILEPILQRWKKEPEAGLEYYLAGSEGPSLARLLSPEPGIEDDLARANGA